MFGNLFGRSNAYRDKVLDIIGYVIVDPSKKTRRSFLRVYPGINDAIKSAEKDQDNEYEIGVTIASSLLTDTIEKFGDAPRLRKIALSLQSWGSNKGFVNFQADVAAGHCDANIDAFDFKLRAAISQVMDLFNQELIADDVLTRFVDEIMGALEGIPSDERDRQRLLGLFDSFAPTLSMGEHDQSPMIPPSHEKLETDNFSGTQVDVRIVPTVSGLALQQKEGGEIISERRTLTQDTLREIPSNEEDCIFVNLSTRSDEIVSCIIVRPKNEVFGDMRAFWWSLASQNVSITTAKANGMTMTEQARSIVYCHARGSWESAIKQTSIFEMRDLIMPHRNIHFEVIRKQIDTAETDAARMGLEITLAMVLAIQSEDDKLERYAYRSLKQFLWLPGEEPEDLIMHDM